MQKISTLQTKVDFNHHHRIDREKIQKCASFYKMTVRWILSNKEGVPLKEAWNMNLIFLGFLTCFAYFKNVFATLDLESESYFKAFVPYELKVLR